MYKLADIAQGGVAHMTPDESPLTRKPPPPELPRNWVELGGKLIRLGTLLRTPDTTVLELSEAAFAVGFTLQFHWDRDE